VKFPHQFRAKWLWYSLLAVICWGAWAILSKLGSSDLSARAMQFYYALGSVPVAIALIWGRRFKLEWDFVGISYATVNGLLSSLGNLAVLAGAIDACTDSWSGFRRRRNGDFFALREAHGYVALAGDSGFDFLGSGGIAAKAFDQSPFGRVGNNLAGYWFCTVPAVRLPGQNSVPTPRPRNSPGTAQWVD